MRVCSLASGSSGNSLYFATDSTGVLVDAGLSGKAVKERLDQIEVDISGLQGIIVTHEHDDHIKGVGVLSRRYNLPIYATPLTWAAMGNVLGIIKEDNRRYLGPEKTFTIGDLEGEIFSTYHDARDPIGINFFEGDRKVSFATDTGCLPSSVSQRIANANMLILEANHDVNMLQKGSYPWTLKKRILGDQGHLSNECAGHSLAKAITGKTEHVLLAHLSQENNLPSIAYNTVAQILAEAGIEAGQGINLKVASRHLPGPVFNID